MAEETGDDSDLPYPLEKYHKAVEEQSTKSVAYTKKASYHKPAPTWNMANLRVYSV